MLKQRIKDWYRERLIKRLGYAANAAFLDGDNATARERWHAMAAEIGKRSKGQVRRMERRLWERIKDWGTRDGY